MCMNHEGRTQWFVGFFNTEKWGKNLIGLIPENLCLGSNFYSGVTFKLFNNVMLWGPTGRNGHGEGIGAGPWRTLVKMRADPLEAGV